MGLDGTACRVGRSVRKIRKLRDDGDGDFVQVIGYAISADAVFFNPGDTVIEVA